MLPKRFDYRREEAKASMKALNSRPAWFLVLERNQFGYHPLTWRIQDEKKLCSLLDPFGAAVFSLFPDSAAPERSIEALSRVQSKIRNKLGGVRADDQSTLIFNRIYCERFHGDMI